jgi:hypothetical protein
MCIDRGSHINGRYRDESHDIEMGAKPWSHLTLSYCYSGKTTAKPSASIIKAGVLATSEIVCECPSTFAGRGQNSTVSFAMAGCYGRQKVAEMKMRATYPFTSNNLDLTTKRKRTVDGGERSTMTRSPRALHHRPPPRAHRR